MSEMAGIEKPIYFPSFDLQAPDLVLTPTFTPLRDSGRHTLPPRYVPGPLADGMARVILGDDYYTGTWWRDYRNDASESPDDVFDIPAGQSERWREAEAAYHAMQDEIGELMQARRHAPVPPQRGPYIPQP